MTRVMLPTASMAGIAASMLYERVPADYADSQAQAKAKALGKEFAETPWAKAQGAEYDLDEMVAEALSFARARGYELLDEPPCEYPATPETWVRCWGPRK
jgi:hypothetical protein